VLSEKHRDYAGEDWHRDGDEVSYKVNELIRNKHLISNDVDKQTYK
jgi:hypothetical protein